LPHNTKQVVREAESNDLTGVLIGFSASRTTCFVLCGNRQMKVDSTKVELVFEVQQIRERQLDVNSTKCLSALPAKESNSSRAAGEGAWSKVNLRIYKVKFYGSETWRHFALCRDCYINLEEPNRAVPGERAGEHFKKCEWCERESTAN
jgi:hypothetical protein